MRHQKLVQAGLLLGLPLSGGVYFAWMNEGGYCFAEHRYLSEQEKIDGAIANVLKNYPPAALRKPTELGAWRNSPPAHPLYYKDIAQFRAQNPACCTISLTRPELEGSGASRTERLLGKIAGFVEVNYAMRYLDDAGVTQALPIKQVIPVSNCGKYNRKWYPGDGYFEYH